MAFDALEVCSKQYLVMMLLCLQDALTRPPRPPSECEYIACRHINSAKWSFRRLLTFRLGLRFLESSPGVVSASPEPI